MPIYRQYFIGGPWHGDDKLDRIGYGDHPVVLVKWPQPMSPEDWLTVPADPMSEWPKIMKTAYKRHEIIIGGRPMTFYVDEELDADGSIDMAAALLLKPHERE